MYFDKDELNKATFHIAFDAYHFRYYWRLLREGRSTQFGAAFHQALVYSLLVHFRILLHFFYGASVRDDDCWVGHFRVLPEFDAAFPKDIHAKPSWETEVRQNLNKRLAHFTATRWRDARPPLDYYRKYFPEIDQLIDAFEKALPDAARQVLTSRFVAYDRQYAATL